MPLSKAEQDKINLANGHRLTNEDRVKGGKASGEAKRQKRTMREIAAQINAMNPSQKQLKAMTKDLGTLPEDVDRQFAFMFAVYTQATKGDVKAMKLWTEITDELATKKKELEIEKLQAELDEIKAERAEIGNVSVNIEIKDCKQ